VERTSFAERGEPKGYVILELSAAGMARHAFHELPSRPMVEREIAGGARTDGDLRAEVRAALAGLPPSALVRLRFAPGAGLEASAVRELAPPGVLVEVAAPLNR
jgi:hypothetical protein